MKTNLKTFPSKSQNYWNWEEKINHWKEDFEAELREIQKNRPLGSNKNLVVVYIKDLLGETEK